MNVTYLPEFKLTGIKTAASKVKGVGNKITGVIKPLGVVLPVAAPNINALMSGGPMGVWNYNAQALQSWRPPDMNTVRGYVDGPGGAAFMTSLTIGVAKWGIDALGFSKEAGPVKMLLNAVGAWADGSAMGYAVKEVIYPSASGLSPTLGGISFGGGGGQPAKGSSQEMVTKDRKPKTRSMMM